MNAPDYESIWQQSLIRVTDKLSLPPIVLRVDDAIIGTLGNFSVSTGKAKAKKTFNVSALVASALAGRQRRAWQIPLQSRVPLLSRRKIAVECGNLKALRSSTKGAYSRM